MAIDFEALMLAKVRAAAPDLDTTKTSVFSQISAKPYAGFNATVADQINRNKITRDLREFAQMTEDELDALAANFFVVRKVGAPSVGTVTIFYETPQDVTIPIGQTFSSKTGSVFIATKTVTVTKSALSLAYDRTEDAYKVTVPFVQSISTGDQYNVGVGEIVQVSNQTENIKFVTNLTPFSKSVEKESSAMLAARIKSAASMRNLCSADSANALLSDDTRISFVSTIGAGDPEMTRDIKFGIHINGYQDTYLYGADKLKSVIFEKPIDNPLQLPVFHFIGADLSAVFTGVVPAFSPDNCGPVVFISKVEYGTGFGTGFSKIGDLAFPEDFVLAFSGTGSKDDKNSINELWQASVVRNPDQFRSDLVVRVTAFTSSIVPIIQTEFKTIGSRSAAHSTLFKAFIPALLNVSVVLKPNTTASKDPAFYASVIESLVNSSPIAAKIDGSDIIFSLEQAGADRVELPISATVKILYPDLESASVSFNNNIDVSALERPEVGASLRTIALYPGEISVTIIP